MDGSSLDTKVKSFLLSYYRTMPQGTIGVPPSQLQMGRQLRTCLDQIIPDLAKRVQDAQLAQKRYHDNTEF